MPERRIRGGVKTCGERSWGASSQRHVTCSPSQHRVVRKFVSMPLFPRRDADNWTALRASTSMWPNPKLHAWLPHLSPTRLSRLQLHLCLCRLHTVGKFHRGLSFRSVSRRPIESDSSPPPFPHQVSSLLRSGTCDTYCTARGLTRANLVPLLYQTNMISVKTLS